MRIGIVINEKKPNAKSFLEELLRRLKDKRITPLLEKFAMDSLGIGDFPLLTRDSISQTDLVLALGGDGTLLRTAGMVEDRKVPIMGINLGGLGFLTGFSTEEAFEALDEFLNNQHKEEKRMILKAEVGKESFFALNDFTIAMGPSRRIIELILYVGEEYVCKFVADGVIVSTPTGSTAYSLAAGGPILYPVMEAIIVAPICPHALSIRPLIFSKEMKVYIEVGAKGPEVLLTIDGQSQSSLNPGDKVAFSMAGYKIRLVMPKEKPFYTILQRKLKWGTRGDDPPSADLSLS